MEKQKNILYLECNSGISGDMTVAALLDLGADREVLKKALKSIPIHGFRIKISRVKKAGLDVCDFHVILDEAHENHDHDMEYLFGEGHVHDEEHSHVDRHVYAEEHGHVEKQVHAERHNYEDKCESTGAHIHGIEEQHVHIGEGPDHDHHRGAHDHIHHQEDAHSDHESTGCHGDHYYNDRHHDNHEGDHHHDNHGGDHHHGRTQQEGHHDAHHHHHEHRGLPEILHIIEHTHMTEGARKTAVRIFKILAKAEAKAHGLPENEVHFHEVGAVDSIVDIISAAVCLDDLGVTECIVPGLCEGTGTIRCQHGIMSVPVPAVLNIVQEHQLKLSVTDIKGELVTPTGAAIAAAVKTKDHLPKSFRVIKTGMGGGKRAYERPSILRAMLIEDLSKSVNRTSDEKAEKADKNGEELRDAERNTDINVDVTDMVNRNDMNVGKNNSDGRDVIYKLESNIDDCSGEALGYVMDRLLEAGARDVHYMPVYMKKNRPAYQLNVICNKEQIPELENIIFAETTTIGIRRQRMERSVLPRRSVEIMTDLGGAAVKECRLPKDGEVRYYPEYDSVAELCRTSGKPYQEVYQLITEQCKAEKGGSKKRAERKGLKRHRFFGRTER